MSKKTGYTVESDFDDLHGDPAEPVDLEVDLSDSDNPIIKAFIDGKDDDDYVPPKEDKDDDDAKGKKKGKKDDKFIDDDEEDDTLVELDDDEEEEEDLDDDDEEEEEGEEEEDDDDEEEEEEDDDEPGKKGYSKKVQARIDRERDIRLASEATSNARIAKLERENKLFKAQSTFKEEGIESDRKLRALRKEKAEAIDEGDTEKQVDIDDKILDIKSDRKVKQFELKQLEDSIDDEADDEAGSVGTPAAGQKWLEKYPQFHSNKKFQRGVLLADKMVAGQGLDKNTDKYYREMEKILAVQYPSIVKLTKVTTAKNKRKAAAAKKKKRGAVGGTQRAGTRRARSGVVRLTKSDQEQMEIFGMDPKNVKDVKAWADSKAGK